MRELNIAAQLVNKQIKKKMLIRREATCIEWVKIQELLPARARPEKSLAITFSPFTIPPLPSLYK
jgi:hypothetical protein